MVEPVSSIMYPETVRSAEEVISTAVRILFLTVYFTAELVLRSAGCSTALCELNSVLPSSQLKVSTVPAVFLKVIFLPAISTL
ncbi:hypothetical protein D3C80_1644480 [compost metagenome]